MSGDLNKSKGKAPSFILRAAKDPDGANLDRMQVIKGWLDADGNKQEKVYDVAVSGNRIIENEQCNIDVGSTVDFTVSTYNNTIGTVQLETLWKDPDFDLDQSAFNYVRVIEIPTPRWTSYDSVFFEVQLSEDTKMTVQDRAYTSPI